MQSQKSILLLLIFCFITVFNSFSQDCYTWKSVCSGQNNVLAIKTNGTLWAWGENESGQLGNGSNTTGPNPIPLQIGTDTNWRFVNSMGRSSYAIKSDGTLWAWGENGVGQLGDGSFVNRNKPVQVGKANNWKYVTGNNQILGIREDGTLWSWGAGVNGFKNGFPINRNSPLQISPDSNWKYVAWPLGLKMDGTLWRWFSADQHKDDSITLDKITPKQYGKANDWESITCNFDYDSIGAFAIKTDSTLWGWGNNYTGQLGDSTNKSKRNPTQIGKFDKWKVISHASGHVLAIKKNGSLWSWGHNWMGAVGDGTKVDKNYPVHIGIDTFTWKMVATSTYSSFAIKTDGTLWAWGHNAVGQLGINSDVENYNYPVRVYSGCQSGFKLKKSNDSLIYSINKPGIKHRWDFGDGKFSTQDSGLHIYSNFGTYNVCLTVNCSERDSSQTCNAINYYCNIDFTTVSNFDTLYYSYTGNAQNVRWDLRDGNTSTSKKGYHIYSKYGIFNLSLTTFCSSVDSSKKWFYVRMAPYCKALFIKALDTSQKFKVLLLNKSSNSSSTKYYWTFGDGSYSNSRNPAHAYNTFGKFKVCLEVSSDASRACVSKFCDSIGLDSSGKLLKAGTWDLLVKDEEKPTGINQVIKSDFKIYPNPTNNRIFIQLSNETIHYNKLEIFNSNGQKCFSQNVDVGSEPVEINIEKLNQGLYLVKLMNEQGYIFTNMIKN